jgi:hypothetical protein
MVRNLNTVQYYADQMFQKHGRTQLECQMSHIEGNITHYSGRYPVVILALIINA